MRFTITKGNKRFVNKLCKQLGISIDWRGQNSLGYEVAEISTKSDYSFQELISFNKSMYQEFSTIEDAIHIDLSEVDAAIRNRKADFNKKYSKTFEKLKENK